MEDLRIEDNLLNNPDFLSNTSLVLELHQLGPHVNSDSPALDSYFTHF